MKIYFNTMKAKEKARQIYDNASKLFKPEEIKAEALISANNIYHLAPYNKSQDKNKDYWIEVIKHLEKF